MYAIEKNIKISIIRSIILFYSMFLASMIINITLENNYIYYITLYIIIISFASVYPYLLIDYAFRGMIHYSYAIKISLLIIFILFFIFLVCVRDNYFFAGDFINYSINQLSEYSIFHGPSRCVMSASKFILKYRYVCSMHAATWWFGSLIFLAHSIFFAKNVMNYINTRYSIQFIIIMILHIITSIIITEYLFPSNKFLIKEYYILTASYAGIFIVSVGVFIVECIIFFMIVLIGQFINEPNKDSRRM